jgi:NADH dehydrogenase
MNVLVTGGTGFVGREIVRQLRISGHRIHLLSRSTESRATQEVASRYGAKIHAGNVLDRASLQSACAGVDGIIHLVGIISEVGDQTFENIHEQGTRNIVFAAKDAGVRSFVHMSALGTRPNARSRYHQSKWEAEERVRRSSLGWTLFRPSIIYGPGDGFVNLFAKIIRFSPLVPVIGLGKTRFQPVPVRSVASAFVKALTEPRAIGETCDLCGPETFSLDEIVDQILGVMRRRRLKFHISFGVARRLAAFLEFVFPRLLHKAPPLNCDQLIMLEEDCMGDGSPANQMFGLKPVLFREGIAAYLKRDP